MIKDENGLTIFLKWWLIDVRLEPEYALTRHDIKLLISLKEKETLDLYDVLHDFKHITEKNIYTLVDVGLIYEEDEFRPPTRYTKSYYPPYPYEEEDEDLWCTVLRLDPHSGDDLIKNLVILDIIQVSGSS